MSEVSRDELNNVADALREALGADRAERIEQMTRFETKFDTRMDAIYQMLADAKERNSGMGARITHLEGNLRGYMETSDRRFSDLLTHFDTRLNTHKKEQGDELESIGKKQDRNWGWVMALIGGVALLIIQAFWAQTHPAVPAQPDIIAPVKK